MSLYAISGVAPSIDRIHRSGECNYSTGLPNPICDDMSSTAKKCSTEEIELRDINSLFYGRQPNPEKDAEAHKRLKSLVEKRYPQALTLYSVVVWHGYGVQKDPAKAYALACDAVDLGDLNAMVVIASMHCEGAGCEKNFATTVDLIDRFNDTAPSVPIGLQINEVGPGYFNLIRTELEMKVNGKEVTPTMSLREELINWIVGCKRQLIIKQLEILERNPTALGGQSRRRLPFKGASGGSLSMLKGKETISYVGFSDSWLSEEIWFDTNRFDGWPSGLSFGDLVEFDSIPATELAAVRKAYQAHKGSGKEFLLKLSQSSVHRSLGFFCGDKEIASGYED